MPDVPSSMPLAGPASDVVMEGAAGPQLTLGLPPGGTEREFTVATRSRAQMVVRRFLRHRLAMGSLFVFVALGLLSVIAGHLWRYNYTQLTPALSAGPSLAHPMGTDGIGHDLFAQMLRATEKSIQIALLVAVIATTIGVTLGAVAGFYGKIVDSLVMRFTDLILTLPLLAVLILLANNAAKEAGNWFLIGLVIAFLIWTYVARLVRGTFLSLREKEYVEAARAIGAKDRRIITRHMLPNAIGPIIVNATLTVGNAILLESALSFLGVGVQPPETSLGVLVAAGQTSASTRPWLFYFPAVFIIALVLCVNFVGDGLRDAFDPGQTRVRA